MPDILLDHFGATAPSSTKKPLRLLNTIARPIASRQIRTFEKLLMSAPLTRRPTPGATFTEGSILRHVIIMTMTGSVGLMAIFVVELLSILYISRLGIPGLIAGVGFAGQVVFFAVSISIGLSIAASALVARALGAGDRRAARRLAASGLIHSFLISSLFTLCMMPFRLQLLEFLGARGVALDAGMTYLNWTLPTVPVMSLGMALSGLLRSVGDAKRAMYVTLFGAIAVAILDPIFILWMKLDVFGATIGVNVARIIWVIVGLWGTIRVHHLIGRPAAPAILSDMKPLMRVAFPAVLTNFAAPVAMAFSVRIMSQFGESAVAAGAIIDRVVPVAFGVLFAMSSVVGPIVGQNYGARAYARVRATLTNCFVFSGVYVCVIWFLLWLGAPQIIWLFAATGETAHLVTFFCTWGAMAWAFLGCLFAANAAFNNLDFALVSTVFNWGRATLGTMPFVYFGAHYYGPEGVIMGITFGAALFGVASIICAYWLVARIEKK